MTLQIPPGFLTGETAARIGCDWLEERGVPLADVLLWYASLGEPEGPPTALVGEYSGRLTGDAGRAARVKRHGLFRPAGHRSPDPDACCAAELDGEGVGLGPVHIVRPLAGARRELQRRVLGLFPEVRCRCDGCGGAGGTWSDCPPGQSFWVGCRGCDCGGSIPAPDLVPPEPIKTEEQLHDRILSAFGVPADLVNGPSPLAVMARHAEADEAALRAIYQLFRDRYAGRGGYGWPVVPPAAALPPPETAP